MRPEGVIREMKKRKNIKTWEQATGLRKLLNSRQFPRSNRFAFPSFFPLLLLVLFESYLQTMAKLALPVSLFPWSLYQFRFSAVFPQLTACLVLISYLTYFSTMIMEVICSSETSIDIYRRTWSSNPEHISFLSTLSIFFCEKLQGCLRASVTR
jgi:hypothetical protein